MNTLHQQWDSPISDYDIFTEESCKFLFEQSKFYFEETIQESEELTQRGLRTLFLLLPAIAALVGFCISNQEKLKPIRTPDLWLLALAASSLLICIFNLFELIRSKTVHYRGTKPKELMRPEIFKLKDPIQIQKALYISETERS